jgi:membrane-bound ClpP family serine protease
VQGALWRARPPAEQEPIELGDRVVVESVDGLTLNVSRLGSGGEDATSEAGPKGAEA